MADLLPFVNVGALMRKLTLGNNGQDEDILPGVSVKGGDRTTANGAPIGATSTGGASGSWEPNDNPQFKNSQPTANASQEQGVAQAAADAREKANTIGMLDEQLAYYDKALGRLDGTWDAGKTQLQDAYDKGLSRLNEAQSNALTRYNTQRGDAKQAFNRSTEDIDNQAYNNFSALNALLGRAGAGSSSAAQNVVPYAVSQTASKARGGVADSFGKNMRDLGEAEEETKTSYKNSVRDLGDQRNTSLGNLENDILTKRRTYEEQRADALGKKAQAQGGNWQTVKNAMQGAVNSRDNIDDALAGLLNRHRNPYDVKAVAARDVQNQNYAVDSNGVKVNDQAGTGNDTDTSGDYLARIKEAEEEKKKKEQGVYA